MSDTDLEAAIIRLNASLDRLRDAVVHAAPSPSTQQVRGFAERNALLQAQQLPAPTPQQLGDVEPEDVIVHSPASPSPKSESDAFWRRAIMP